MATQAEVIEQALRLKEAIKSLMTPLNEIVLAQPAGKAEELPWYEPLVGVEEAACDFFELLGYFTKHEPLTMWAED